MGIEYRAVEARMCPMLFCDACGERIEGGNGIVVYDMHAEKFVCKLAPGGGSSPCNSPRPSAGSCSTRSFGRSGSRRTSAIASSASATGAASRSTAAT